MDAQPNPYKHSGFRIHTPLSMTEYDVYEAFKDIAPICTVKYDHGNIFDVSFVKTERIVQLMYHSNTIELDDRTYGLRWCGDSPLYRKFAYVHVNRDIPLLWLGPDPESPGNILNVLNDDCLRTIFESTQLNLMDLGSIASVCKRFKRVARQVIDTIMQKKDHEPYKLNACGVILCRVESFIEHVGSFYPKIQLSSRRDLLCAFYRKYCKKVNELHISINVADCPPLYDSDHLLERVRRLRLHCWTRGSRKPTTFLDLSQILTPSSVVEELLIDGRSSMSAYFPAVHVPSLKCISINKAYWSDTSELERSCPFFLANQQLVKLSLHNANGDVLKYLQKLEHLELSGSISIPFDDCRNRFERLKVLHLNMELNTDRLLEHMAYYKVPLEYLTLVNLNDDDNASRITTVICLGFPTLKYIYVRGYGFKDDLLMRFAEYLNHLESIELDSTDVTSDGVLQFVAYVDDCFTHANIALDPAPHQTDVEAIELIAKLYGIQVDMSRTVVEPQPLYWQCGYSPIPQNEINTPTTPRVKCRRCRKCRINKTRKLRILRSMDDEDEIPKQKRRSREKGREMSAVTWMPAPSIIFRNFVRKNPCTPYGLDRLTNVHQQRCNDEYHQHSQRHNII